MGILNDGPHIYAKVVHGLKAAKRKRNKKDENMEIEAERTHDLADTIDLLISKLNKKEWKTLSENIQSKLCKLEVCTGRTIEKVIYNEGLELVVKTKILTS